MKQLLMGIAMASILVLSSILTTAHANTDKLEYGCHVVDDRDGDAEILDKTGIIQKDDEKTWLVKNLKIKSTKNNVIFSVSFEPEDGLYYLSIYDKTKDVSSSDVSLDPRKDGLYSFLSTKDFGIYGSCEFRSVKD